MIEANDRHLYVAMLMIDNRMRSKGQIILNDDLISFTNSWSKCRGMHSVSCVSLFESSKQDCYSLIHLDSPVIHKNILKIRYNIQITQARVWRICFIPGASFFFLEYTALNTSSIDLVCFKHDTVSFSYLCRKVKSFFFRCAIFIYYLLTQAICYLPV